MLLKTNSSAVGSWNLFLGLCRGLFATLLFFGYVLDASAEKRVALIIGNGDYREASLRNPVNDARDMKIKLQEVGFSLADIVYRENLKVGEIGTLLREWKSKLSESGDTVALIYYAGHGMQIRGENYFPAVDARIDGAEDVPHNSLKLATLLDVLSDNKTRLNLIFLDACRNNPYSSGGSRTFLRGLAPEKLPSGTMISYATRSGSVAEDGNGRNGVFTSQLLENISAPGTIDQMMKRLVKGVRRITNDKQVPWFEGSTDEDFYFSSSARVEEKVKIDKSRPSAVVLRKKLMDFGSIDSSEAKLLEGVSIKMRFSVEGDEVAIQIRKKLESLGAKICDFEPRSSLPEGVRKDVIYYDGGKYLDAAGVLVKLLKNNGFVDRAPDSAGWWCDMYFYVF
ncbi:MAG: hypothetical protein RL456_1171 [Pseudomonadota bacterium]|jgi:Fe2+ transport system protein FeoA